jgi:hypothetical protein
MSDIVNYGNIGERTCYGLDCANCIRVTCPFDSYEDQVPTYNEDDIGPEGF